MKYLLLAYAAIVALALTVHTAPQKKGPACGAGVLCIREQRTVHAIMRDITGPAPSSRAAN